MRKCSVEGCEGKHRSLGYCERHYRKLLRDGTPDGIAPRMRQPEVCTTDGCDRPPIAKGLCAAHRQQAARGVEPGSLRVIGAPNMIVTGLDHAWVVLTGRQGTEVARAAIDFGDIERVRAHRWRVSSGVRTRYVLSHSAGALHRFLLDAPSDMEVDHIDRDGLNNRRVNLRLVTRAENAQNMGEGGRAGRELPRNVYARGAKFLVQVTVHGRAYAGGTFGTLEDAERAAHALRDVTFTHHVG